MRAWWINSPGPDWRQCGHCGVWLRKAYVSLHENRSLCRAVQANRARLSSGYVSVNGDHVLPRIVRTASLPFVMDKAMIFNKEGRKSSDGSWKNTWVPKWIKQIYDLERLERGTAPLDFVTMRDILLRALDDLDYRKERCALASIVLSDN